MTGCGRMCTSASGIGPLANKVWWLQCCKKVLYGHPVGCSLSLFFCQLSSCNMPLLDDDPDAGRNGVERSRKSVIAQTS